MIIFIFCTVLTIVEARELSIRNLRDDPLLILKTQDCALQTGNIKLIHPINLTELDKTIDALHTTLYQDIDRDSGLFPIIKHKIQDLYTVLNEIKPRRHRRWDALGSAWKWLAGSPDADDLRIINTTLNELVDQHNVQYRINNGINERLTQLTKSLNTIIEVNRQSLNDSADMAAMKLLINVNVVESVLGNIQDAILGTKIGLPSSKFLTFNEISLVASTLEQQGIVVDIMEEALNYAEPKIATKDNKLLYILQMPQIDSGTASVLEVIPLPVGNQTISNIPKFVIKTKSKLFITNAPDAYIQKYANISPLADDCIHPLLVGTNSSCTTQRDTDQAIQMVASSKLLVTNAVKLKLTSNCGPDDKIIHGNVLVTFSDCEIQIGNNTYKNLNITEKEDIQNLFYETFITVQEAKTFDLQKLNETTFKNGKLLENVHLNQTVHVNLMFMMCGVAVAMFIAFVFVICIYQTIQRRLTLQQPAIQQPTSQQSAPQQPTSKQPASQQPASQQPTPQQPASQQPTPKWTTATCEDALFHPPEELRTYFRLTTDLTKLT